MDEQSLHRGGYNRAISCGLLLGADVSRMADSGSQVFLWQPAGAGASARGRPGPATPLFPSNTKAYVRRTSA